MSFTALTNYHKSHGVKQHKRIISQFRRSQVQHGLVGELAAGGNFRGKLPPGFLQLLGPAAHIPWLVVPSMFRAAAAPAPAPAAGSLSDFPSASLLPSSGPWRLSLLKII